MIRQAQVRNSRLLNSLREWRGVHLIMVGLRSLFHERVLTIADSVEVDGHECLRVGAARNDRPECELDRLRARTCHHDVDAFGLKQLTHFESDVQRWNRLPQARWARRSDRWMTGVDGNRKTL